MVCEVVENILCHLFFALEGALQRLSLLGNQGYLIGGGAKAGSPVVDGVEHHKVHALTCHLAPCLLVIRRGLQGETYHDLILLFFCSQRGGDIRILYKRERHGGACAFPFHLAFRFMLGAIVCHSSGKNGKAA